MFLPPRHINELFHFSVTYKYSTIFGIQVACITCCYVGQTSGNLSGCQEQPFLKSHAYNYNLNMLVNGSIATESQSSGL